MGQEPEVPLTALKGYGMRFLGFEWSPRLIMEVGVCDGADSEKLLEDFPWSRLICFEADMRLAAVAAERLRCWGDRVVVVGVGLGDCVGRKRFNRVRHFGAGHNVGYGSLWEPTGEYFERMEVEEQWVMVIDAERIFDGLGYGPEALWLDAQGAEPMILRGLGKWLLGVEAVWVEVEYGPMYECGVTAGEVAGILRGAGFELGVEEERYKGWWGDQFWYRRRL